MDRRAILQAYFRHETIGLWDCWLVPGLIHYQWSRNPRTLQDPTNKAIAIVTNALLWVSSVWYFRTGIKENGWVVGLGAALQAWAVGRASLR
ncbi:hypothetical protein F9C07_9026 [Aspergillus flavus]|uniref:Uncharacterized protein n=1 Tax=Aspergillus flavus (strain ATCC 200026 / FGSC A1120 / IAM 13836 / NRRL 3357 / JCM 12722 / SRRC 167) TaxID=332952 RepID=A0A7U2MK56_ASPFN|nr:hypothetical protein F9C07_9026 [Aspergillus flavus]